MTTSGLPLFEPYTLRDVTMRNRIVFAPVCQYSSTAGFAAEWHLVHLGSRAVGGAGLVFTEAAAVSPEGRISQHDLGIWKDEHVEKLAWVTRFIREYGSVAAIQLAHSGRKGSVGKLWARTGWIRPEEGGWVPLAPSPLRDLPRYPLPMELSVAQIADVVREFADAARRADAAGFGVVEIHAAHGYLLHEFLSPLSNERTDAYGGSFENRCRILLEVTSAVRAAWPERKPLFVRIAATDWEDGGWSMDDTLALSREIKGRDADLISITSGGLGFSQNERDAMVPLYQVPFAAQIRREIAIPTMAVGLIDSAAKAAAIVADGHADLVAFARKYLSDTALPHRLAHELGVDLPWPHQLERAFM